ncbi:MAG TPA: adenylate/guanylate cyclase domain-containing protein, partial [Myxococcota bacterium]|nr:adenylate/guanylate cyclase domain-containing protein [Myxococcota bacterium]
MTNASAPNPIEAPHARSTRATVLFADIVGFTALSQASRPERAYFAVTGALRILDEVARRHGGSVDKYLGDSLLVVFGHPVPLPEPARAASLAALEMREQLRDYAKALGVELDLVVGINTGTMVAGDVGRRVIREFHVLGDAVNVAARLKSKAPRGAIYVGPETRAETQAGFEHRALGSLELKGKARRVALFELVRSRERRSGPGLAPDRAHTAPFVGRRAELAQLGGALEELAQGRGGCIVVVGEAGCGKSRLFAEAGALPAARKVASVHAFPSARTRPGALLATLLEAVDPAAARRLRTGATRGDAAADLVAQELRRRAGEQPLVVALEDLQRADAESLALLPRVVAGLRGSAALLLLSCNTADGGALGRSLVESCAADELSVGPLSDAESRALLEAVSAEPFAEASTSLLLSRGAGHPGRLVLGAFLEPTLRAERELRGQEERASDAERRRATILFADITGFTAMTERIGAERAYPIVVDCLHLLDEIARRHGGSVDKYLGDCVMALFGVPEAIEDAPRAALNAAIEMRRRVREYSERLGGEVRLDVHSGIHTGLGIAGDVSGPLVREFAVMGDPVNTADALKDLAPHGAIYVGEDVVRATRDVFEYRELARSELGEERRRVGRAFELLSTQERLHRARIGTQRRLVSSLVGRDRELATLREALSRLCEGRGGIASVIAEAGLGKSRLLAELAASEGMRELAWREGRSISTGRHQSFHPIADLCRGWAGIGDEDDEAGAREKLRASIARALPGEVDEVLPFIAAVVGLPPDAASAERLAGLQGDAMAKLVHRSVTQLLRGGSRRRPIVVVMDDLHWADLSSIELLEDLLRLSEDHPIFFFLLFRPGVEATSERVRERARTEHAARYVEVELRPLDGSAARAMLNNLFRQGDLPHATRQTIEEKARGNPFYIEEVVRALVDEGAVEYRDGHFVATERIEHVVIPGTIQEVVMARLDGLSLRKKQIVQTACVIGGTFHCAVLAEVVGDDGALTDALQDLLDAEFLVPSDRLPGEEYAFKHPLIQEVAYDGLIEARRTELH